MPNGFYHVKERTEENQRQLDNLKAFGYAVEFVEGMKCGVFTDDGREVVIDSLHDFIYYGKPLQFTDGQKPSAEHQEMAEDSELKDLQAQCTAKGIKFRADAKAGLLRKKIEDYDASINV